MATNFIGVNRGKSNKEALKIGDNMFVSVNLLFDNFN